MSKRIGLDLSDIAACYRHRAAEIADDKMPKPLCAVIVEFNVNQLPTLILFGDKDRIINPSAAQTFHERMPGSDVVLLKNIGHLPMEEAPDATAMTIADFVTRRLAPPSPLPAAPEKR